MSGMNFVSEGTVVEFLRQEGMLRERDPMRKAPTPADFAAQYSVLESVAVKLFEDIQQSNPQVQPLTSDSGQQPQNVPYAYMNASYG